MSNISLLVSLLVGILGFLFLFWRRLKEDYSSNQIFSFGFLLIFSIIFGFFLGLGLYNIEVNKYFNSEGLWFWGAFLFGILGFCFANIQFKLRFFETLESCALGFIFWFFTICLISSVEKVNLKLLLISLIFGSLIPFFFFINSRYKSFTWYKSGKIGFTGLLVLGIFFLMRSIIAIIDSHMLSFIGKSDIILDSIVSFIFFITLYNLSER